MTAKKLPSIALSPVKGSSQIDSIGHEGDTLAVKFKSGGATYHYQGVSADQFDEFRRAKSLGSYLATHIKPKHKAIKL